MRPALGVHPRPTTPRLVRGRDAVLDDDVAVVAYPGSDLLKDLAVIGLDAPAVTGVEVNDSGSRVPTLANGARSLLWLFGQIGVCLLALEVACRSDSDYDFAAGQSSFTLFHVPCVFSIPCG